jgi:hypothetical protein
MYIIIYIIQRTYFGFNLLAYRFEEKNYKKDEWSKEWKQVNCVVYLKNQDSTPASR